jgi:hypothetical protein
MPCAGRGDDEATGGVDEVTGEIERHGTADGSEYDDDFEESLSAMDEGSQRAVADVGVEHSRSMDLNGEPAPHRHNYECNSWRCAKIEWLRCCQILQASQIHRHGCKSP